MHDDVIEEAGDYRVRLEYDDSHEFPDFIQSSVIAMSDRYLDFNDTSGLAAMVRRERAGRDDELIERWLKVFYGVRAVAQVDTRDTTYFVLLTEEAVSYYGTPDDRVQQCVDGDAEAFQQWINGEVYGYVVEKRTTWQRLGSDGEPVFMEDPTTIETWEQVDSLWGLYGREYAEAEARGALTSEAEAA